MLPPAPRAPFAAREIVRSVTPPLSPDASDSVLLMTSEVVSNALRHGRQPSEEISLRIDRGPHNVRVEVLNEGPVFVPEPPFQPNDERDGGYGLYLVDHLSSSWGVEPEDDRTKVWFEVRDEDDA